MGTQVDSEIQPLASPLRRAVPARLRWFFLAVSWVLILIIAVAFAPTFYLRGVIKSTHILEGPMTPYIVLHGIVLTSWYLLFAVQTWLVATGRTGMHRALGVAGGFLAGCLLVLSTLVLLRTPARDAAIGASVGQIALEVVGDFGLLTLFAGLVTAAILYRRRPDVHKRLMTLASIGILAPALARWPGAAAYMPLSAALPQFALCGALIVYDTVTRRRIHPATAWVIVSFILVAGASVALSFSPLGRGFIKTLM